MNKISAAYPSHYILGEEGAGKDAVFQPEHEVVWVIDPIDGTTNFVHQQRSFSISVAVYDKGEGVVGFVYDPVHKELFHAIRGQGAYLNERKLPVMQPRRLEEALLSINPVWLVPNEKVDHHVLQPLVNRSRGIRCIGSAALETAYVACGRIDAYVDFRLSPWDIAAGLILLQETGAIAADPANGRIDPFHPSVTVFSKPGLHETILSSISNNVD